MYYFCTYFDHRYLPRGLALYHSLRRHCPSFRLWVLCMDRVCYNVLSRLGLSNIHLITLEDLEKDDEELLNAKQNRSTIEYYFTCTPSLPLFVLHNYPEVDVINYLDADLFFFADPGPLFDEIADRSIAIIPHRFPEGLRDKERFGIYNVGWLSFRRDEHAFACLRWWRERCLEWCYDRCEGGRYADQKYLDHLPRLFRGVVVLRHKGANLAPYNIANYKIREDEGRVWVEEQPLIFYHYHGFNRIWGWLYDPNLAEFKAKPSGIVKRSIYLPYIQTLVDLARQVSLLLGTDPPHSSIRGETTPPSQSPRHVSLLRRAVRWSRRSVWVWRRFLLGDFIIVINGRVV